MHLEGGAYTEGDCAHGTFIAERELDAGLIYINASTIGAEIQLPFGETKHTGAGPREADSRGGALNFYTK